MTAPTTPSERIDALDQLRGIALFGVLLVNLVTGFRVSLFDPWVPHPWAQPPAVDIALSSALSKYVEVKALVIFSFLFGVGLALQRDRAPIRTARRLGMLLAMGLVHMFLIWNGDILVLYAVVGVVAAPILRLPTSALLVLAVSAFALQVAPIPFPPVFPSFEAVEAHVHDAHEIYGHGTFLEVLAFRIHEVRPMSKVLLQSAPSTLGLFLLGACFVRSSLLRPPRNRLLLLAIAITGISTGLAIGRPWSNVVLGLGYAAAILLLSEFGLLRIFAPLGRMALTNYLAQSVILGFLFYGYGLGLFGRLGVLPAVEIAIAIYLAQMIASALWLRTFRFGPAEWLWRSFTYGARQRFRH